MPTALPTPDFSRFYRHDELTALLRRTVEARPDILRLESIGRSHEGRDLWLVVATNAATGADTDKPAFWVDGNIHAAELTASTAVLYWLHRLAALHGADPAATPGAREVTELLDTRCVYLVPRLNPDGAELALAERPRHIRSGTRPWPYDEAPVDGLTIEDVDGDGRILTMRVPDPHGGWRRHPQEPRLMVAREPGELPAPGETFYRLLPEGRLTHFDGLTVRANPDREGLDFNRNFPSLWRQEHEQLGAGPYPASEPEVRAMVDFVVRHPNIGAAVSFHTHSGVILRPMGTEPDEAMIPEDLWLYQRLSKLGERLTGYPAINIFHDFKYHPKSVLTGTQDWFYEHLGALFWTVELWSPNREAGIEGYKWIEWYRDHPVEDDLKLLRWSDSQCEGRAFVDWRPFEHPQLGPVEIGGWDKMNFWRNPPPALREREVARFPAWLEALALSLPRLVVLDARTEALGPARGSGGVPHDGLPRDALARWRVRLDVGNAGYLAAAVTRRAVERKQARALVCELEWPADAPVRLLGGSPRLEGPQLEGHAPKTSPLAFLPQRELTADRARAEWLLEAPAGTELLLRARAGRAGTVTVRLRLG